MFHGLMNNPVKWAKVYALQRKIQKL